MRIKKVATNICVQLTGATLDILWDKYNGYCILYSVHFALCRCTRKKSAYPQLIYNLWADFVRLSPFSASLRTRNHFRDAVVPHFLFRFVSMIILYQRRELFLNQYTRMSHFVFYANKTYSDIQSVLVYSVQATWRASWIPKWRKKYVNYVKTTTAIWFIRHMQVLEYVKSALKWPSGV